MLRERTVRFAAFGYVLCYTIFFGTLALLPGFSAYVLKVEAWEFGALRATWSVGALVGSVLLSVSDAKFGHTLRAAFAAVLLLGCSFIGVGQTASFGYALAMLALAGAIHSGCRSLLDGYMFAMADETIIGRVRGNVNSLINVVSLVVFGALTMIDARGISWAMGLLGASVAIAAELCRRSVTASAALASSDGQSSTHDVIKGL